MNIKTRNGAALYERIYDYGNLYRAYAATKKTKRWKNSTIRFELEALLELKELEQELRDGTYQMRGYNVFQIYEPKLRTIKSIKFRDKVVQRSLCDNVLELCFEPHLIYDNYACRKGKGTHAGLKRTADFMRKHFRQYGTEGWVLKCDVEKYFDSIPHDKLKKIVAKLVLDERVMQLLNDIIDSTSENGKGLPLGNQTSQWFSVLFLSEFDHFIKEKLGVKMYLRYMDDFVLIHHDKAFLQKCKLEIIRFLESLDLKLNEKSHIFPLKNGTDFLGFHLYLTDSGKVIKKIRKDSKKRVKRKLRKYKILYREGKRTEQEITQSYNSWKNHARHGNCFNLVKSMDKYYKAIFEKE